MVDPRGWARPYARRVHQWALRGRRLHHAGRDDSERPGTRGSPEQRRARLGCGLRRERPRDRGGRCGGLRGRLFLDHPQRPAKQSRRHRRDQRRGSELGPEHERDGRGADGEWKHGLRRRAILDGERNHEKSSGRGRCRDGDAHRVQSERRHLWLHDRQDVRDLRKHGVHGRTVHDRSWSGADRHCGGERLHRRPVVLGPVLQRPGLLDLIRPGGCHLGATPHRWRSVHVHRRAASRLSRDADPATATILGSLNTPNGWVQSLFVEPLPPGYGGYNQIFLGGQFSSVGGQPRNRIASLAAFGPVTSWDPNANGTVHSIAQVGSTVYVGGAFGTIGGAGSLGHRGHRCERNGDDLGSACIGDRLFPPRERGHVVRGGVSLVSPTRPTATSPGWARS